MSFRTCFGLFSLLSGQSLLPVPPAIITANRINYTLLNPAIARLTNYIKYQNDKAKIKNSLPKAIYNFDI
jgi:hypothetical protein